MEDIVQQSTTNEQRKKQDECVCKSGNELLIECFVCGAIIGDGRWVWANLRKRGFCGMDFSRTEDKFTKLTGEKPRKTPKKAWPQWTINVVDNCKSYSKIPWMIFEAQSLEYLRGGFEFLGSGEGQDEAKHHSYGCVLAFSNEFVWEKKLLPTPNGLFYCQCQHCRQSRPRTVVFHRWK